MELQKSEDRLCPIIDIVIPCYCEEEVLPETSRRILEKLMSLIEKGLISDNSRIMFVDDGSKDRTWELIEKYHAQDPHFGGIKLAHNRGHQHALLSGLMSVRDHCDAAISMDADLQDDINVVDEFVAKYKEGCEIVYGVRKARDKDTFFKRSTALAFYRFMEKLGVQTVNNHADYRLMGKRALDALSSYREVNLYLRGIVPSIGYKTDVVYYDRAERFAGESKYPLKKMLALAIDGVTSFSIKPLELIFSLGVIICVLSVLALIYGLLAAIFTWPAAGIVSLIGCFWLLGGILLIALGIVGVYVGKTYQEAKDRPRYIIEKELW
ncbi:MAG: glycosyltransferase family 2 protein [Firmicutes bacterium]|nr:glycosyltransferase family 2 protein [Bacillota bacterium]